MALAAVPGMAVVRAVGGLPGRLAADPLDGPISGERWLPLLKNTALVGGIATAVATGLGAVLGLLIARTDLPGRRLLGTAAILGACIPAYASAVIVVAVVPVWAYASSAVACGVIHGLLCLPLATVILGAAFRAADRDLEDNARLDASSWLVVRRVTVPQAAWGIALVAMIVVWQVATDFTIADLLVVRTFAEEVYTQFALHRSAAGPVLTAAPVFAALTLLFILIHLRYRPLGEHSPWRFGAPPRMVALGRWRWAAGAGCLAALATAVGVPAVALLRKAGSPMQLVWRVADLHRELLTSAAASLAGATLVVALAVGLGWIALRTRGLRYVVGACVVVLLAAPAPVVGISLIELLNRPGYLGAVYDSPAVIVVGYLVRFLPVGLLLLLPAVQRVPADSEAAARVDGCGWLGVQRHVYWPAAARDALVAWLVIVILCFGEVSCSVLLAPPRWPPAAVRAFTLLHFGVYADLAALALATIGCIMLPWLVLVRLLRRTYSSST